MYSSQKNSTFPLVGQAVNDLEMIMSSYHAEPFRSRQLFHWLYAKQVNSFDEMVNLPKPLREKLQLDTKIHTLKLLKEDGSGAGTTRKFLFQVESGEKIETVLMFDKKRTTVCLSTQVGCAVDCQFCATGKMGFVKNLSASEIVDQYLLVQGQSRKKITNVVFMGMGEPFLNYDQVMNAAELLNHPAGIRLGVRKITISTVGIVSRIKQYAEEGRGFKLAISLNASEQQQRATIMPIAKKHTLNNILKAAQFYFIKTNKLLTFEYVLMKGINDQITDAENLIKLIGDLPCKLNVIPYNEIGGDFFRPGQEHIQKFVRAFKAAPFTVTVRWSYGTTIQAGCGQLAVETGMKG
jgi:23S rRNA (adenine2503-C2)-methyltransferase